MTRLLSNITFTHVIIACSAFIVGAIAGSLLHPSETSGAVNKALREVGKYRLVSPLLACGDNPPDDLGSSNALKTKIANSIAAKKTAGEAEDVSVYVRTPGGAWIGIDENLTYAPASLLKIPLMIAYFKLSETDPGVLSKQLFYDGSFDDNKTESFKSENVITPGWYTVERLLHAMIVDSDNNATLLLKKNIDTNILTEVYNDLGVPVATNESPSAQSLSAREFSYFFRVLYNATYLTPENSEQALELLANPGFTQGIRATVPENTTVADKFGERTLLTQQGIVINRELHDCGIVFNPKKHYLLCIMTRGRDFKDLTDVIQSIGRIVYNEINTTN